MDWKPGYIVNGKYRIESILGAGGFGSTYKVTHIQSGLPYVLKKPHAYFQFQPDYPRFRQRFIKEGQILAKLVTQPHPHIIRVFDLLEVPSAENSREQMPCLLIELIPGVSLYEFVKKHGALPEVTAIRYIRQIGEALTVVHKTGLVHWDVTPGNIMLKENADNTQDAVLIDFGIAGDCPPSSLSRRFGNRAFAPYEQIWSGERTPGVDLYSLGASLYYAVTGQQPMPAVDCKSQNLSLIPPVQHIPTLDARLNKAILAAMALEPQDRPKSVAAWLEQLGGGEVQPQIDWNLKSVVAWLAQLGGGEAQPQIDWKRYDKLRDLLAAGEWQEADKETRRVMLAVANREEEGRLNVESIDKFPCEDLKAIDFLWVKYSNGRFGFSVQKRIYQELGGTREYDETVWEAFGDRVGWRKRGDWLYYYDLNFSTKALPGHLPMRDSEDLVVYIWLIRWFSRIETCEV